LVYVLVGSKKHSALASVVKNSKNSSYPKNRKITKIVIRVAQLINRGAPASELEKDAHAAARVDVDVSAAAAYASHAAAYAADASADVAYGAYGAPRAAAEASAYAASADAQKRAAQERAAQRDYAAALLYFVEQEAYGRRTSSSRLVTRRVPKRRSNPSSENVPSLEKLLGTRSASRNAAPRSANPKTAKKTAKKSTRKAPLAKTLIAKCQKAWDHYCAKPSKKRLEVVFDLLEVMKKSSAKTVKEERARCLRAANKEAKRLKMKR